MLHMAARAKREPRPQKGVITAKVITAPDHITDAICRRLAEGQTMDAICSDPDMPSAPTLWRWRKSDPLLDARLAVAAGVTRKPIKAPPAPASEPGPETWTPLGIMLTRMRELWDDGHADDEGKREAISIAKDAAPYVHPRLSAVDARITHRDLRDLGEDELLRELAMLRAQAEKLLGHDAPRLPVMIDQLPEPKGDAITDDNTQDCQQ